MISNSNLDPNLTQSLMAELQLLEQLCSSVLVGPSSSDNSNRQNAEYLLQLRFPRFSSAPQRPQSITQATLQEFQHLIDKAPKSPQDSIFQCIELLSALPQQFSASSASAYLGVYIVSYLQTIINSNFDSIPSDCKIQLCKCNDDLNDAPHHIIALFILQFLYQRPTCPTYIATSMGKLYGTLIKVSWFDSEHCLVKDMEIFTKVSVTSKYRKFITYIGLTHSLDTGIPNDDCSYK